MEAPKGDSESVKASTSEASADESSTSAETSRDNALPVPPSRWFEGSQYGRYWQHEKGVWRWYGMHSRARQTAQHGTEQRRLYHKFMISYHRMCHAWTAWQTSLQQQPHLNERPSSEPSRDHDIWKFRVPYAPRSTPHRRIAVPGASPHQSSRGRWYSNAFPPNAQHSSASTNNEPGQNSKRGKRKRRKMNKSTQQAQSPDVKEDSVAVNGCDHGDGSQHSDGDEDGQLEIDPAMLDFFSKSAKHRKDRETDKKNSGKEDDDFVYVDIADATSSVRKTTVLPPSERPGAKRTAEMKQLYGAGAAMIHGMETAMQLTFDKHCDTKKPKHWPHLPLNIRFKD